MLAPGDSSAPRARSLRRGLVLGAEEAARTMALFGDSLELRLVDVDGPRAADSVEQTMLRSRTPPAAIVRASDLECLTSRRVAQVPTIEVACGAPGDTAAGRTPNGLTLFLRPATAVTDGASAPNASTPVLWHESLERFGAEQLNQRYARRFALPMDSDAWAGWFALKLLSESALRAHATTARALARALTDSAAQFDGHKGVPLRFDTRTRVLRQPLYLVARDSAGTEHVTRELPPGPS